MRIIRRVRGDGKNDDTRVDYAASAEDGKIEKDVLAERGLSAFRAFAAARIAATDQFVLNGGPLPKSEEPMVQLSEVWGDDAQKPIVTVWSKEWIDKQNAAPVVWVELLVSRRPRGLGDGSDKTYTVKQDELNSMTLDQLRTKLEERGFILEADQFSDQGVAVEKAKNRAAPQRILCPRRARRTRLRKPRSRL